MTVTNIDKDTANLTMTVTAEFDAPVDRVWQLWENPRLLERWWGPPTYPATFVEHDLVPGGTVTYFMTGSEGDQAHGWWRVLAVEAPHHLELEDGFADDRGAPDPTMPTMTMRMDLYAERGVTRMTIATRFPSVTAMEQIIAMGMEEGMRTAVGQIDALLAVHAFPQ